VPDHAQMGQIATLNLLVEDSNPSRHTISSKSARTGL